MIESYLHDFRGLIQSRGYEGFVALLERERKRIVSVLETSATADLKECQARLMQLREVENLVPQAIEEIESMATEKGERK